MLFSGDIIIIDPCYAMKKEDTNIKSLGFSQVVNVYTFWQDCGKIRNIDTGETLGTISAESGELCVLYHDELLNYNPDYFKYIGTFETTTIIHDFHGDITTDSLYGRIRGNGNINFETVLDVEEEKWVHCEYLTL